MHFSLPVIVALLTKYRYSLLFPIAVIEGPIIAVIAGFLISLGKMSFIAAFAVLILGDLVGDTILYIIGRWGAKNFLYKFLRYFRATPERIKKAEDAFRKHSMAVLFFGKWSHAFGFVVLTAAGIIRLNYFKFIAINFLGTLPKVLLLVLIGYYFGQAYMRINSYIDYAVVIIVLAVIVGGGIYYLISKLADKALS